MPRDIPVGNGSLLVNFDVNYNIRDFYFPYVGRENHSASHPFRFGVWVDGKFSWMGPDWDKVLTYRPDTLITDVRASNKKLGLELICHDAVDFHLNIYLKQIVVKNLENRDREVRLFFNHDFHIYGNAVGDTAYYDPYSMALIHYKNSRYFLVNCCDAAKCGVDQFACGVKEFANFEGSWKDAEFMVKFRDKQTKLPLPSYDLWEERYGVHSFTVASVIAGLYAASNFACAFGEDDLAEKYLNTADEMKEAMVKYLYHEGEKRFVRMGTRSGSGYELDMTVDASLAGIFQFGAFSADDPLVVSTMQAIRDRLWVKTKVGGMARYVDDTYQQQSKDIDNIPGNPWFICTMWLGQYEIARAKTVEDLERAVPIMEWVAERALESGVLAEQVHPETNAPLSVSPLTWSHATYVTLVCEYMEKLESLKTCPSCGHSIYQHLRCKIPSDT